MGGRTSKKVATDGVHTWRERDLTTLFSPNAVCVVGASRDSMRLAGRPLIRLRQHGFEGRVYAVNPKYASVGGYPCFQRVADVPEAVDVALIVVPADHVPAVLTECGRRGIKNAVVLSSGFEDDPAGWELAGQVASVVKATGMNLVGPNSEGIWSVPQQLTLTFGSAADRTSLLPGPVSVVSQSGSVGGACVRELQDSGIGCRYFVSTGNETDLSTLDFVEWIIAEGGSRVVLLFIERLSDGRRLAEVSRHAREGGVALVVLRGGTSDVGRLATISHSGRIASVDRVYRSVLRQVQMLEVRTFSDLVSSARVALWAQGVGWPARTSEMPGIGVGIVAVSGGGRALLVDSCAHHDVPLADFGSGTLDALQLTLPRFGSAANPVDVTGEAMDDLQLLSSVVEIVAQDPHTDGIVVQLGNRADASLARGLGEAAELARRWHKPLVVSTLGRGSFEVRAACEAAGVLCAEEPDDVVRWLSWAYGVSALTAGRSLSIEERAKPLKPKAVHTPVLSWDQRVKLVESWGIPVVPWVRARRAEDVVGRLHFPVVAKVLPHVAEHKTERDMVRLNLHDVRELTVAMAELSSMVGADEPLLVQEMVQGGVEVIVGVRQDPDFGAMLSLGSGGERAEVELDIAHLQIPTSSREVLRVLQELRVGTLLAGFRGREPSDVEGLVRVVLALASAYLAEGDVPWEVEINPLMVLERGRGVLAVDILWGGGLPAQPEPSKDLRPKSVSKRSGGVGQGKHASHRRDEQR